MSSEPGVKDTTVVNGLPAGEAPDEDGPPDGRVIGGRASLDDIYLIDRAALEEGMKRGPWIVKACIERARMILASKTVIESKAS